MVSLLLLVGNAFLNDAVSIVAALCVQVVARCDNDVELLITSVHALTENADQVTLLFKVQAEEALVFDQPIEGRLS